jgi:cobalt-zinc-cadmium efflux system membrane fusion protein
MLAFVAYFAIGLPAFAADEHAHEHKEHEHEHEHEHAEHGHDEPEPDHEKGIVKLSPEAMREFGIEIAQAGPGTVSQVIELSGEVVFNADRIAHVTPTVAGIVQKVHRSVGDRVEAGQVMAVLSSRELAAARSVYLAASARLELARDNAERDQRLFEQKVGAEHVVLESRQALREAQITVNQADSALHALGYSHEQIEAIESLDDVAFNMYDLMAPLSGIVTQRHLTVGEVIDPADDEAPFVVADLSTVWVNLTIYQRDLTHVKPGQRVHIRFGHDIPDAEADIAFVSPALDETTRTATARVVLDNPKGDWRPGLFVTGQVHRTDEPARIVVPRSAVIQVDGRDTVFVQTGEGFAPHPVKTGRKSPTHVEIVDGLAPGARYVARNVLALKAELNRAALEHAGHAH